MAGRKIKSYVVFNFGPTQTLPYGKGIFIGRGSSFQTSDPNLVKFIQKNESRFRLKITEAKELTKKGK